MTAVGLNEQQLQKMQTHPGFIAALDQSGGSTPNAAAVRHQRRCVVQRGGDVCHRASDAHAPMTSLSHSASGFWPPSCSRTPWTETSRGSLPRTICGT